jgi:hypothetical protein
MALSDPPESSGKLVNNALTLSWLFRLWWVFGKDEE